ncbi:MAG: leucine-rich repeat protein, partial [Eubacterium sp.]|nr:leucine-rich repeat protein [Eubacterium sp.]
MKKIISIICSITILIASVSFVVPIFAATGNSIDTVVEELSELYQEEAESGKKLEDSAQCRIIVKANRKPDTYGDAQFVKGTDKIYIYQYSDITSANSALEHYNSLRYVQWAETDGVIEGQSLSYGNDMMGSDEAKNYVVNNNISLSQVNIALIDTGVKFTNEMFTDRVVDSGVNLSSDGRENSAYDNNGHGSHIASILVDNTTDNVKITAYKVTNKYNQGTHLAVAQGIEKAVNDGADVISLSITSQEKSEVIVDAVKNAYDKGVIIVNSAGNASDDVAKYYPANMEEVFTVGAIDKNGNRAFFSNFGEEIDFVAPGHFLEMSGYNSKDETDNGTSFSVPFVSAAAAMVLSVSPNLSISQVKQQLINSCVSMKDLAYYDGFHAVEEYAPELQGYFVVDDPKTDEECFGYGMPQILKAMNITGQNSSVSFSAESGTYYNGFELTLSADDGAKIYYTTDESYPSANNGTLYTEPVLINSTTSVRAIAVSDNKSKSIPKACEYKMAYYADESDFEIDNRGYITKYNGDLEELIVPEIINNITAQGVTADAFNYCRRIIFPDTVKVIEGKDYINAIDSHIEFIEGKGITRLEDYALGEADSLLVLDAPNLEYIGSAALQGKFRVIDYPKLKYVDDWIFAGNKHLKEVNLPSIEAVPYSCFKDCYVLRTVKLDNAVSIDTDAFAYCYRLKNIYAPKLNSLLATDDIDVGTFHRCYNLTEVDFPLVTSDIPEHCFDDCLKLEKVKFDNVSVIKYKAFNFCQKLNSIYFPKAKTIEQFAFYMAYNLKNADLPSVETIEAKAFVNAGIETVNAPNLKKLGSYAFAEQSYMHLNWLVNPKLTTLVVPNLSEADNYAFAYTGGLTELDLPNLTTIGENAFYESSVNSLYAPNLETAKSLPMTENSTIILSSLFKNCTENTKGRNYNVYGITGSDAETWAKRNNHTFVGIPAIITDIPDVYNGENSLSVKAIGIDVCYKWYGCDNEDGIGSILLNTETDGNFNPLEYRYYPYYFCVCEMEDNGRKFSIQSAICKNADYRIADYSKVDELINKIPADLSLYTDESVAWLNNVLNNIQRDLPITEQNTVDGYADKLEQAISRLALKEFPTEPTNPTQPDDPSTEPSTKPTTIPKENTTKPCVGTTEKPSESQNRTSNSDINHNQSTKRNT